MAKFIQIEDIFLNVDQISYMSYDEKEKETIVFCSNDTEKTYHLFDGNVIYKILNANNDLSMRDKQLCNHMSDKFKTVLSAILARLDSLTKNVEKLMKKVT